MTFYKRKAFLLIIVIILFVMLIMGVLIWKKRQIEADGIQRWHIGFSAEEYFGNNREEDGNSDAETSIAFAPYAYISDFSEFRAEFEEAGKVPLLDHTLFPDFYGDVEYNDDKSIYEIFITWHNNEDFHHMRLIAAPEKIEVVDDVIYTGEFNNATVTVRDGIEIAARGTLDTRKTIEFDTGNGWYQIQASHAESYEQIVEVLDWVWENPIDFSQYSYDVMQNL